MLHDVDPKVLARLIKQEKKGLLMWQKRDSATFGRFEFISNGKWAVIVDEITEPAVRLSLFAVFDKIIEAGQSIEMHYGEIQEKQDDFYSKIDYRPEYYTDAATLTRVQIGATGLNPAARFIYDGQVLTAVDPDIAELSNSNIVYRGKFGGEHSAMFLGEHKEIFTYPIRPYHEENRWESILQKFTGTYMNVAPAIEPKLKNDEEYPEVDDDTYNEAVAFVIEQQQVSVSMIQRKFRVGYTDASRIVDRMELEGIIGKFNGSTPRAVLLKTVPGSDKLQ